jgi:hypothetical protein
VESLTFYIGTRNDQYTQGIKQSGRNKDNHNKKKINDKNRDFQAIYYFSIVRESPILWLPRVTYVLKLRWFTIFKNTYRFILVHVRYHNLCSYFFYIFFYICIFTQIKSTATMKATLSLIIIQGIFYCNYKKNRNKITCIELYHMHKNKDTCIEHNAVYTKCM